MLYFLSFSFSSSSSSSSSSSLSCLRNKMMMAVMMMMFVVSNAIMSSSVIVCPNDHDCEVNCSPYTRNCYNNVIKCPMSINSTNTTYNCTVYCLSSESCVGTTVEATESVANLYVFSYSILSSENMNIIADGTETVKVGCGQNSCLNMSMTVREAALFSLEATLGAPLQQSALYNGRLNISNTKEVSVYCDYWGCTQNYWFINHVDNFNWICNNYYSCYNNVVQIGKSTNVTINAVSEDVTTVMDSNQINIADVDTATMNIVNGTVMASISMKNINNFLYTTGPTAYPFISWNVQNVTNVALGSWNVTSYWIVEGMPIQKQYICPDGRDCNIRVDANLSRDSISVICPTDSVEKGIQTTCQFYCSTTYSACNTVDLQVKDVTNAVLYFSNGFWPPMPFSVSASAYGLTNIESEFSLVCYYGCTNATINIAGYSKIMVRSTGSGMYETKMMVTDATFAHLTESAYQGSNWDFSNIDRVQIDCLDHGDCSYANFHSVNVSDVSVTCTSSDTDYSNCWGTIFNMSESSSFNLTCRGVYVSCYNMSLQYNGSKPDETSFQIACELSDHNSFTCSNISIRVTDNKIGFDALDFICERNSNDQSGCEYVNVYCGDEAWCHCPVKYSKSEDDWYCDGECGTKTCTNHDNNSGLSSYAIVAIVLACTLVTLVGLVLAVRRFCCKKKEDKENLLGIQQNNYV